MMSTDVLKISEVQTWKQIWENISVSLFLLFTMKDKIYFPWWWIIIFSLPATYTKKTTCRWDVGEKLGGIYLWNFIELLRFAVFFCLSANLCEFDTKFDPFFNMYLQKIYNDHFLNIDISMWRQCTWLENRLTGF